MKNFRDSTFPCSAEQSFLGRLPARAESEAFDQGSLHGQERNAICEANRESESMQTARPGRNAKRFDQGTRSPSGIEPKKTMGKLT